MAEPLAADPAEARVVEVRGRRISVAPEPASTSTAAAAEPILDEPPAVDSSGLVSSVAPSERISDPAPPAGGAPEEQRPLSIPPAEGLSGGPYQRLGELYDLGDFSGALAVAEEILKEAPGDPEATNYRESCREVLMQMFESRIGDFDRAPKVAISQHDLLWRSLDATAGFVLSQIDGMSTFEDVVDVSGLPRFEICRILDKLLQDGIIE
jgi:hypothetical protein